jgi:hypothetical protein
MSQARVEISTCQEFQELTAGEKQHVHGGAALLLPAVQAAREAASRSADSASPITRNLDGWLLDTDRIR